MLGMKRKFKCCYTHSPTNVMFTYDQRAKYKRLLMTRESDKWEDKFCETEVIL